MRSATKNARVQTRNHPRYREDREHKWSDKWWEDIDVFWRLFRNSGNILTHLVSGIWLHTRRNRVVYRIKKPKEKESIPRPIENHWKNRNINSPKIHLTCDTSTWFIGFEYLRAHLGRKSRYSEWGIRSTAIEKGLKYCAYAFLVNPD